MTKILFLAMGILLCIAVWAARGITPDGDRVLTVGAADIGLDACGQFVAATGPKETIRLHRVGDRMTVEVWYDGVLRGTLATVDVYARTVQVPTRPPHGWLIGGRE